MSRYVVEKSGDGNGNQYVDANGGKQTLVMCESDRFEDCAHYVHANGGEVIDLVDRMVWAPSSGWESCDEYLQCSGR